MDKAFLEIGGQPIIERVVERMTTLGDEVILVTNTPQPFAYLGLRMVEDVQPGQGVLGGLYSGLLAASHDYSVVVACDMPFLNLNLLRYMILLTQEQDVVIPRLGNELEPLHAIYSKRCLEPIGRALSRGERRVVAFLPEVRVRYVDRQEIGILDARHLSFFNVNTREDWERALQLAEEESDDANRIGDTWQAR
jgi:molybdopterin-guanine dinucleotide biosynthesis protein A